MRNTSLTIRLPPALHEKLIAYVESQAVTKSEVLALALTQYLDRHELENPEAGSLPRRLAELEQRLTVLEQQLRSPHREVSSSDSAPTLIPLPPLTRIAFEVVTVNRQGKSKSEAIAQVSGFAEPLADETALEMIYLPGGSFVMGAADSEKGVLPYELPAHEVKIAPFALGKFTVTQAQWRVVAQYPKINRDLNPDPAHFKDDQYPVDRIAWYDAVEFCDRLSQQSGRHYRLPSEAEWEYACRAGTPTPFHYGETLTGNLANYVATRAYAEETSGIYLQTPVPVGSYPPNAYGFYEMHGNIWEWCADHWHPSYENAPTTGSAWLTANPDSFRLLRGGSWDYDPEHCRSAYRNYYNPHCAQINQFGFRVACDLSRHD